MLCLWGVVPACDHFVARSWWSWWCLLTIRWRCGNCGASMAHVSGVEGMVPSSPSVVPSSRAQCAITAGHPPECLYHPTQRLISSHPVSTHPDSSTATWSPPHSQDQQFRCDQCDCILAWEERVPLSTQSKHTIADHLRQQQWLSWANKSLPSWNPACPSQRGFQLLSDYIRSAVRDVFQPSRLYSGIFQPSIRD